MNRSAERSRRRFLKVSSMFGLAAALSPWKVTRAFAASEFKTKQMEDFMTPTSATQPQADKAAIRPFQFKFSDAELADLRRRVNATKWPDREQVTDASQGVQLATMQKLALLGDGL